MRGFVSTVYRHLCLAAGCAVLMLSLVACEQDERGPSTSQDSGGGASLGSDEKAPDERSDPRYQWNLEDLFPSVEAWNAERERLLGEFTKLAAYQGTLGNGSADLYKALRFASDAYRQTARVHLYSRLTSDEDLRNAAAQERHQLSEALLARFREATAWMDPEIIAVGPDRIHAFLDEVPDLSPFRHSLENKLRQAEHTLGDEAERTLAYFSQSFGAPQAIYGVIADSDIPFPVLDIGGEQARIDSQGYSRWRSSPDRDVRKQVFDAFWGKWKEYRNSVGVTLQSHIRMQVALAKARKYDSVLQRELDSDNLPPQVFHTLVAEVNRALPTLHRYFKLRGRMLGVDQMHYYDIYPPLVSLDKTFDIEITKTLTLDAMSILGEDWVDTQRESIDDRWMHVYPRQGKRSGAYMNGTAYDVHPYLLLNHNDDFDGLSTFAHEWGHAMHTLYARQAQPFETAGYATFIAEIPSTSLELILQEFMTDNAVDTEERLFYLGYGLENLRGTFFRQTMFAEFELQLYEAVERGEALTGERISAMYGEILRRYHGHDDGVVVIDDLYTNEWMFIPHFYLNMYVFQYATSLTAGTALYSKIVDDRRVGVENFKSLLRAGGSDYPYNILRNAGVDLGTPEPYQSVIDRMNGIMDEMERLLDERAAE
jgi:oligoendopeptidase F